MAITAKVDAFAVAGATETDVQPAAGEVWLVKAFAWERSTALNMDLRISLWDGTDRADLINVYMSSNQNHGVGPGLSTYGAVSTGTAGSHFASSFAEWSVIFTNTVRMRFYSSAAMKMGYSGVQLA